MAKTGKQRQAEYVERLKKDPIKYARYLEKSLLYTKIWLDKDDNRRLSNLLSNYSRSDRLKDREFNLTIQWCLDNVFGEECDYCGAKELIGVDRIDNSIGHIETNCHPVCYRCNSIRGNHRTHGEMLEFRKLVDSIGFEKARETVVLSKEDKKERYKRYQEINKEKIISRRKRYYEKNKEKIKKKVNIYRERNQEKIIPRKKKYYEDNKQILSDKSKEYRKLNKEEIVNRKKQYYLNNKERLAEKARKYREENKERLAEKAKLYYEENKERIIEKVGTYREENKEKIAEYKRQYRLRNKDAINEKKKPQVGKDNNSLIEDVSTTGL